MQQNAQHYDVFDNDFNKIGTVKADSAEEALEAAKRRYRFVPAPMVSPTPGPTRAQRSTAPRGN